MIIGVRWGSVPGVPFEFGHTFTAPAQSFIFGSVGTNFGLLLGTTVDTIPWLNEYSEVSNPTFYVGITGDVSQTSLTFAGQTSTGTQMTREEATEYLNRYTIDSAGGTRDVISFREFFFLPNNNTNLYKYTFDLTTTAMTLSQAGGRTWWGPYPTLNITGTGLRHLVIINYGEEEPPKKKRTPCLMYRGRKHYSTYYIGRK